jgi:hypothetical protein
MPYQLIGIDDTLGVIRIEDGATIPPDPENRDWALYLGWKAEGNTASPAATPVTNG